MDNVLIDNDNLIVNRRGYSPNANSEAFVKKDEGFGGIIKDYTQAVADKAVVEYLIKLNSNLNNVQIDVNYDIQTSNTYDKTQENEQLLYMGIVDDELSTENADTLIEEICYKRENKEKL